MILPGGTLGVVGGGQLGRMFTAEAQRLGFRVAVLDPDPRAPAAQIADLHIARSWNDSDALAEMAARCDAITTEFENVPADALRALAAHVPVRPTAASVAPTQDRIEEKRLMTSLGIGVAPWAPITSDRDLPSAWSAIGEPAILKTSRMGYDGKGQASITSESTLHDAWRHFGSVPCVLEQRMPLDAEVSVMVARAADGTVTTWPVTQNVHVGGILHTSVVPASVDAPVEHAARDAATRIVEALDYVGVMGVECFVVGGELLVNEVAPRPHNSGHWTIDASTTSQFEQQARALAGLPLGTTDRLCAAAMVNLLGDLWRGGAPSWDRALAIPGVRLHLYGKTEPRPGRKMGHLTALASSAELALKRALEAWTALQGEVSGCLSPSRPAG
ncbi:MAG: 5-(carboxyamino)imidazole ribonucleotide synthase [Gemmatimonadales bacterium]